MKLSYDENIISSEADTSADLVSDSLDQDIILDDSTNNFFILSEDQFISLTSDSSDIEEVSEVDYTEKLISIENNLQVLNCLTLLILCVVFISGFIRIFNKFFCFDMI